MRGARSAAGWVLVLSYSVFSTGCHSRPNSADQPIVLSEIPDADRGGPDGFEPFQGHVLHAEPGQRIVLFAHSAGLWWLQPASSRPFTEIRPDLTWKSLVHLGDRYAALLVDPSFKPVNKLQRLPASGGAISAMVEVPGTAPQARVIRFGG